MKEYVYERPKLYAKQVAAFFEPKDAAGNVARYSWIEGGTKNGKTVLCMAWLFEQSLLYGKPGREFWWVAPVSGTAKIAYGRIKRGAPPGLLRSNDTELTLTNTINGAVIRFKSGEKPDDLYGEDVWACVLDEASRMRPEVLHAVRSTLTATQGPLRIIGNVKGRKNWFFIGCRKAEGGEKGHSYHKIIATDAVAAGVFPQEELDDARRLLPDAVYRELYLCEASDDGGNPFGLSFIRANVAPLSTMPPACFGGDLAKSVDWTVLHALDGSGLPCRRGGDAAAKRSAWLCGKHSQMPLRAGIRSARLTVISGARVVNIQTDRQQPIVITLVHGTFARGAAWCKPDSLICTAISRALKNNVRFEVFEWSGFNLHSSRVKAGEELQSFLRTLRDNTRSQKHFIIGHSHGGNVIRYAMSAPDVATHVDGVIMLATPFLAVNPRNYQKSLRVLASLFSISAAMIAMAAVFALIIAILAVAIDNGLKGIDKLLAKNATIHFVWIPLIGILFTIFRVI